MATDTKTHWNQSHLNIPKVRNPSKYAKDKEKNFPRNSVVCDLGGGDGTDSFYFIEKGHTVYLYDVSDLALKKAGLKSKELGVADKINISELDLYTENIPVADNFFDIVYARLSLHYFYKERTVEILKEIYRVLKKGGQAFIVVKSPEDVREMEWLERKNKKLEEGIYSEDGHIKTRFTKEQYNIFLKNAGIENYQIDDYTEFFGDEKIFLKSEADKLFYIEIVITKS